VSGHLSNDLSVCGGGEVEEFYPVVGNHFSTFRTGIGGAVHTAK
jgi:hypothetical protein